MAGAAPMTAMPCLAAISALLALKEQNLAHARIVMVIEACEESGSPDLPFYIDHLADRIGTPDLVVCLDSWLRAITTSSGSPHPCAAW